ncbi:hypothetical protein MZO42_06210 [Sphingomonas psychrotolerans]|uniref:Uncharacterized protein n=1 Tax=Sphingomonas psychrotolerans TaxID=1327635 RepID=A0ABU3N153_9SPHN|nr:hypothetical protein [Sphingomonas psychrotolerans]MDT8758284.1 hypothetical protein [Sphingomonas psychrotolerans]
MARCIATRIEEYRDMIEGQDPRAAAAVTAMSLDLAELLATIEEVRAQLQRVKAGLICAQLDAAEAALSAAAQ